MSTEQRLRSCLAAAADLADVEGQPLDEVVRKGGSRQGRNPFASTVAVVVVVAAITVGLVRLNAGGQGVDVLGVPEGAQEVAVFLCDGRNCDPISEAQKAQLQREFESHVEVVQVTYESKGEAYERFQQLFADQPELVRSVSPDALPPSFRVLLAADADAERFAAEYRSYQGVGEAVVVVDDRSPPHFGPDS